MTTQLFPKDPLLTTARVILKVMEWGALGLAAFALFMAPFALWNSDKIISGIAKGHKFHLNMNGQVVNAARVGPDFIISIAGVLIVCAAFLVLMWIFVRLLEAIVDTVSAGDPFVPGNAVRLRKMGWLMLLMEMIGTPIQEFMVGRVSAIAGSGGADYQWDGSGLLTVLTLFILARVFHHGAALRQDLEGTV